MRKCVLTEKSLRLSRGVALFVLAGFGAGCSADMARFTYQDFTTGSVNQSQIIRKAPPVQPFPSEQPVIQSADQSFNDQYIQPGSRAVSKVTRNALAPVAAAGTAAAAGAKRIAEPVLTAGKSILKPLSPARQTVTPVELTADEELAASAAAQKSLKKKTAAKTVVLDNAATGTVIPKARKIELGKPAQPLSVSEEADAQPKLKRVAPVVDKVAAKPADKGGWTSEGGTVVSLRPGETIYNFSKRFGVPVASLLKANGLSDASQVKEGQQIIVPAYRYSQDSGVSAPDANFETASAKSTAGTIYDVPQDKVPLPRKQPAREKLAVLPNVPQMKQKQAPAALAVAEPKATAKTDRLKPAAAMADEAAAASDAPVETAAAELVKPAPAAVKKSAPGSYAVAQGDSLYKIAKSHGVSVAALKSANGLSDGKLKIGQPLRIPASGESNVASAAVDPIQTSGAGQSAKLSKPAAPASVKEYTPPKADDVTAEADQDDSAAPNATGISKLRWPVRGRTVTGYGQRDAGVRNDGIDISVPEGTPIKSAENGVVIYAGSGLKEFGNTVLVRHANGLVTVYGHADQIKVKRGDTIKRGQELATTGMSGNAKAPMLHFEVRKNSAPVDPAAYLE